MIDLKVVYMGQREGVKKNSLAQIIPLDMLSHTDEQSNQNKSSVFNHKGAAFLVVGGIYHILGETNEDGKVTRIIQGKVIYLDKVTHPVVHGWEIASELARIALRAHGAEKKAAGNSYLLGVVKSLARAYVGMSASDRSGFDLWLVRAVHTEAASIIEDKRRVSLRLQRTD